MSFIYSLFTFIKSIIMRRTSVNPDLSDDDQLFEAKYSPLTMEYLKNVNKTANLDDVKTGIVSLADGELITNYSGHISNLVISNLKNQTVSNTKLIREYDISLENALSKLPGFDGQTVYRMEKIVNSIKDYEDYFGGKIGTIMNVPYYFSTSKEDWKSTRVVYIIKTLDRNSRGKDISRITNFAAEKEILFNKNTNFKIESLAKTGSKLYVNMKETSDEHDFVYNYVEIGFDEKLWSENQDLGLFD